MKKTTLLYLILLLVTQISESTAQISVSMVKQAETKRYDLIINANSSELYNLLADEFIYHQPDGKVVTKFEYMENLSSGRTVFYSAEFTDLSVKIYDQTAISRGTVTVIANVNGNEIAASLRFLNVWIYRDGRMQLTARQSAFIQ